MEYTQQEIANFNLIKGALLSRRGIYYEKYQMTRLIEETPRVLMMQYTNEGDKYILFGLLRTPDWQYYTKYVLDEELLNIDPNIALQVVQLRSFSGAISIFDYGIGDRSKPEFDSVIFFLPNQFEDNELEIYREAIIDALTLDDAVENDRGEDQTPLVRFVRNVRFYLSSYDNALGFEDLMHLGTIMGILHEFLERDDSDIIKRIQRRQGTGPNTTIFNIVTELKELKDVIANKIRQQIDESDAYRYFLNYLKEQTDLSLMIIEEKTGSGIPQFYDTLVEGSDMRVVALGSEYTMDQFKRLGKFFIEKKLVYDDFDNNEIDAGCSLADLMTNIAYPVLVNPGTFEQVYCIQDIIGWINTGKTTDPNTRQEITKIRVMNEQDVETKELQNFTKEKNQIEDNINQLRSEPGNMREIRKLEYKKRILDESIRKQKEEKIRRETERLGLGTERSAKKRRLKFKLQRIELKF